MLLERQRDAPAARGPPRPSRCIATLAWRAGGRKAGGGPLLQRREGLGFSGDGGDGGDGALERAAGLDVCGGGGTGYVDLGEEHGIAEGRHAERVGVLRGPVGRWDDGGGHLNPGSAHVLL